MRTCAVSATRLNDRGSMEWKSDPAGRCGRCERSEEGHGRHYGAGGGMRLPDVTERKAEGTAQREAEQSGPFTHHDG